MRQVHVKYKHDSRDTWHPMTAQLINIKAAETTQLWHYNKLRPLSVQIPCKQLEAKFSVLIKNKHHGPIIYISNIDISSSKKIYFDTFFWILLAQLERSLWYRKTHKASIVFWGPCIHINNTSGLNTFVLAVINWVCMYVPVWFKKPGLNNWA